MECEMSVQAILIPMFLEVALTFVLLFWMGFARLAAIRGGQTRVADIALGQPNWPTRETQIANAYNNQFQLPVLFYVVTILALIFHKADIFFVALAYLFVALRIAHAWVHTGTNVVPRRFQLFVAGGVVLMLMWVLFAAHMFLAP